MNVKNKQGHSINFAISVALALLALFVLYLIFKDKYLVDISGKATYITGIFGTAVGLAGAWVAIRIAEIATSAQEQANKFDNPYYQKANLIIAAGRDFIASFEFLVSSAERTRDYSFAEGRPNLVMLAWACKTVAPNLEYQLMSSGLYSMLLQIDKVHNKGSSVYSIVQNLLSSVEELSRVEKTTDLENEEAELIMSKYVIAMLNMDYLAELVKKLPNVEILASLLETGEEYKKPPEGSKNQTCGISTSNSIARECKARNEEILDQIWSNLQLPPSEAEHVINRARRNLAGAWFERSLVRPETHPELSKKIPDLNQYLPATRAFCAKFSKHVTEASFAMLKTGTGRDEIEEPAPHLYRAALIDFGTFRTKDLFQTLCEDLSNKIGSDTSGPVVISAITDLLPHIDEAYSCEVSLVYDRCRLIKEKTKILRKLQPGINSARKRCAELKSKHRSLANKDELWEAQKKELAQARRLFLEKLVERNDTKIEIIGLYTEILGYLKKLANGLINPTKKLFVIELNSDHDFVTKLALSNYLPFAILHWKWYPYLPSPGFRPTPFYESGIVLESGIAESSVFPKITCFTPVIATGALFVVPHPLYDKAKDKSGYAHLFSQDRYTATLNGRL
jgi:hypothetical protein